MTMATSTQIDILLTLAWKCCDATETELQEYATRFSGMSTEQACDLMNEWNKLPITRTSMRPGFAPVPVPNPNPRRMVARYPSTCSACNKPIAVRQEIFYIKGYFATHSGCGFPTVKGKGWSGTATQSQSSGSGLRLFVCPDCSVSFTNQTVLNDHLRTVHRTVAIVNPPGQIAGFGVQTTPYSGTAAPRPQIVIPEKGYFAVEIWIEGSMQMRFYRVTERKNKYTTNPPTYKVFLRQSGDNFVTIDPDEKAMAAAVINAAPILAKEAYGKLLGQCGCCGRSLTDPESRARGIGPECLKLYPNRY